MKHSKIIWLSLSSILLVCLFACKNNTQKFNPELTSLNLLQGDILLCGNGDFGKVDWALSCSYETRDNFNLAISLLHSFEHDEAQKAFAKVIADDPECAMAYWGVAMCKFYSLWRPPTNTQFKEGASAIKIARSISNNSEKETDYIEALAELYTNWTEVKHKTRMNNYANAMEKIHTKYSDDIEAAIFYSYALVAAADLTDKTYKNQLKAAAILKNLFADQPDHPGITHYIIHSFDYPGLANQALDAARRYAAIAPASAHAQHMPSHIFTRLGLWEESIQSNNNATNAAKCYAEQVEMDGHWDEEIHGTDYLVYAYLQVGKLDEALKLVNYLKSIDNISQVERKAAYASASIPARFYLETRQWTKASELEMISDKYTTEKFPWPNGITHFARILGAVNTNNIDDAKENFELLKICHQYLVKREDNYMATQVLIMVKAADAWIKFLEGNNEEALALMRTSAELEYNTEKQPITPGEVLSAQELLGDLLMKLDKPAEALDAYELNLRIRPNRFNGIYGAAIAAKQSGVTEKAEIYFKALITLTENSSSDRQEIKEAKEYIEKI